MSYLSEAHTEWHTVNGWNTVCPLDCGAGEPDPWEYMTDEDIAEYEAWATKQDEVSKILELIEADPWGLNHLEPPF